jgi:hypothetical protein
MVVMAGTGEEISIEVVFKSGINFKILMILLPILPVIRYHSSIDSVIIFVTVSSFSVSGNSRNA